LGYKEETNLRAAWVKMGTISME